MADEADYDATYKEFKEAVNMTALTLEKFLESDQSQSVGQKKGGGEAAESWRRHGERQKADDLRYVASVFA